MASTEQISIKNVHAILLIDLSVTRPECISRTKEEKVVLGNRVFY